MGLFETAKKRIERITTNKNEWGGDVAFKAPTGETAAAIGINVKHHLAYDENGNPVNSTIASVAVSEKTLTDLSYPVRGSEGEVDFKGHTVTFTDSSGASEEYIINQWFPDEAVGLIVCILGKYVGN